MERDSGYCLEAPGAAGDEIAIVPSGLLGPVVVLGVVEAFDLVLIDGRLPALVPGLEVVLDLLVHRRDDTYHRSQCG